MIAMRVPKSMHLAQLCWLKAHLPLFWHFLRPLACASSSVFWTFCIAANLDTIRVCCTFWPFISTIRRSFPFTFSDPASVSMLPWDLGQLREWALIWCLLWKFGTLNCARNAVNLFIYTITTNFCMDCFFSFCTQSYIYLQNFFIKLLFLHMTLHYYFCPRILQFTSPCYKSILQFRRCSPLFIEPVPAKQLQEHDE